MQLSIIDPNSPQSAIERFNILWEVATKKRARLILLRPLMGAILVLVGILSEPYASFKSYQIIHNGTIQQVQHFNLHFAISLGIVFLIYSSFDFLRMRREKNRFSRQYNKRAGGEIKLDLTDETITHDHFGITTIVQWRLFSHYVDLKGYLFLVIDDSPFSSITINKHLLNENELKELTAFLSEKNISEKR